MKFSYRVVRAEFLEDLEAKVDTLINNYDSQVCGGLVIDDGYFMQVVVVFEVE